MGSTAPAHPEHSSASERPTAAEDLAAAKTTIMAQKTLIHAAEINDSLAAIL